MKLKIRLIFIIFTLVPLILILKRLDKNPDLDLDDKEVNCQLVNYKIVSNLPNVNSPLQDDSQAWKFNIDVSQYVTTYGKQRKTKVFLTIGIPSIKRIVKNDYLKRTLDHFSKETSSADKEEITCVIFLSDDNQEYNLMVMNETLNAFKEDFDSGFFLIILVNKNFYHKDDDMKYTFKDPRNRVMWRTKQVLDYNLLFRYCGQLSRYHMQIEDDVLISNNYLKQIKDYISAITIKLNLEAVSSLYKEVSNLNTQTILAKLKYHFDLKIRWTFLDFSWLGFIGKVFRSDEMNKIAIFFNMYYDEMPIDWLLWYVTFGVGQQNLHHHLPSLLQHFGQKSSFLTKKDNMLTDKTYASTNFAELAPTSLHNTVPALLFTNMTLNNSLLRKTANFTKYFRKFLEIYKLIFDPTLHSNITNFYVISSQHFFIATQPSLFDYINVIFLKQILISKVTIETGFGGNECHKNLVLHAGRKIKKFSNEIVCEDLQVLANISECLVVVPVSLSNIICLSVTVASTNPPPYIFFNYIHVSTKETKNNGY